MGQSFIPTLFAVDFIRLHTVDSSLNGIGATLYVNLRSDSIDGPIIGSTLPIFLPDGFAGRTNFIFPSSVSVNPGDTYYFQPVVQSGDLWGINNSSHFNYTRGTAFALGLPAPAFDLWFREGIIIPEPAFLWLGATGICALAGRNWLRHERASRRPSNGVRGDS